MKRILLLFAFCPVLALAAGVAESAPVWNGREDFENGITTLHNPATPMAAEASVLRPDPMWRIGGEDDPAGTLFGLVTDARPTPTGTTWLLDSVLSTLYEVAADGQVLRTVGREGDGPGEFRNAVSLAVLPDRGVGVVEMMPSQMVRFDADGLPQSSVSLGGDGGGQALVQEVAVHGDEMVMGFFSTNFAAGTAEINRVLGVYDLEGHEKAKVLHESETQSGGSISLSAGEDGDFINNWTVGADGNVHVHRKRKEYLIETFAPDGTPLRRVRRDYESVRRPEAVLAAEREQRERMRERFSTHAEMHIEEMAPDIDRIIPRPDGSLWVLSSRGRDAGGSGCVGVFDEIDPAGRFVRQVRIEVDYDAEDDQFLIRGDRLYVLKEANNAPDRTFSGGGGMMMVQMSSGRAEDDEDEDKEPAPYEVICYRLD